MNAQSLNNAIIIKAKALPRAIMFSLFDFLAPQTTFKLFDFPVWVYLMNVIPVTRRMKRRYSSFRKRWRASLVEQELLTLPEHLSSPPVFSGACVTRSLVVCVCFAYRCLSFCPFPLAIVLSVLRSTDSDYPFGNFKLFFRLFSSTWKRMSFCRGK